MPTGMSVRLVITMWQVRKYGDERSTWIFQLICGVAPSGVVAIGVHRTSQDAGHPQVKKSSVAFGSMVSVHCTPDHGPTFFSDPKYISCTPVRVSVQNTDQPFGLPARPK